MDQTRRQEIREQWRSDRYRRVGNGERTPYDEIYALLDALDAAEQERDRLRRDLLALVDDLAGDDTRATYLRAVITRYWPGGSHA